MRDAEWRDLPRAVPHGSGAGSPAPLGARVRAPVGWRISGAPGAPPLPARAGRGASPAYSLAPRERGEGRGEGQPRADDRTWSSVALNFRGERTTDSQPEPR